MPFTVVIIVELVVFLYLYSKVFFKLEIQPPKYAYEMDSWQFSTPPFHKYLVERLKFKYFTSGTGKNFIVT